MHTLSSGRIISVLCFTVATTVSDELTTVFLLFFPPHLTGICGLQIPWRST